MSNEPRDIKEMLTEDEYQVTVKYDDRPQFNCFVVVGDHCVGFGQTPAEAMNEWADEMSHYGPYP